MAELFGRAFTWGFYIPDGTDFIDLTGVAAPESVYVSKSKPSRSDAAAGTIPAADLVQTLSPVTWSDTADKTGKLISFAVIDDPDPAGSLASRTYWVAVNFRFAAGKQIQTEIRALPLERARAWHRTVETTTSTLKQIWEKIDSYHGATAQDNAIKLAKLECQRDLEAAGFDWAGIWRPDELTTIVAYKAVSNLAAQLATNEWIQVSAMWRENYANMRDSIKLEYCANREAKPTGKEATSGALRVIR